MLHQKRLRWSMGCHYQGRPTAKQGHCCSCQSMPRSTPHKQRRSAAAQPKAATGGLREGLARWWATAKDAPHEHTSRTLGHDVVGQGLQRGGVRPSSAPGLRVVQQRVKMRAGKHVCMISSPRAGQGNCVGKQAKPPSQGWGRTSGGTSMPASTRSQRK